MKKLAGIVLLSALTVVTLTAGGSKNSAKDRPNTVNADGSIVLKPDTIVRGNIEAGKEEWYSIRPDETGILTVQTIGSTDTYIHVYDAERNLIKEDDDGGDGKNAKIELIAAARTNYLVKVSGYSEIIRGPYRIFAVLDPMPAMTELRSGSFFDAEISSGEEHWYSMIAVQTGIMTIQTSGDTDTLLEANDENFSFVASDDDGGEGLNAKLEIDVIQGKIYYIKLTIYSYGEDITSSYRITAENTAYPDPVQLRPGSFISGNISPGENYWYSVRTEKKGILVVETTGNLDTYLYAYNDSYQLLAYDDDSGAEYNARIELPVEENRTYIFKLRGLSYDESGPYRIFAGIE